MMACNGFTRRTMALKAPHVVDTEVRAAPVSLETLVDVVAGLRVVPGDVEAVPGGDKC